MLDHAPGSGQRHAVSVGSARLAVASDRSLIAEAVVAALSQGGVCVQRIPWPSDARERAKGWPADAQPPHLALMLCELTPWSIETAQRVVAAYPTRWVLLTDTPRGPPWGAMLDAGVSRILTSTTTMAQVLRLLAAAKEDPSLLEQPDRDELVRAWRAILPERMEARVKLASLTRREREVLRLLRLGQSVQEIADNHGVATSTVRSQVRSILRKLGVRSQLAAVAYDDKWADD